MKNVASSIIIVGVTSVIVGGCNSGSVETAQPPVKTSSSPQATKPQPLPIAQENSRSPEDDYWHKRHPGWYERQFEQDCPPAPQDKSALRAVSQAHNADRRQNVYGEIDPFYRKTDGISGFKSHPNPYGQALLLVRSKIKSVARIIVAHVRSGLLSIIWFIH